MIFQYSMDSTSHTNHSETAGRRIDAVITVLSIIQSQNDLLINRPTLEEFFDNTLNVAVELIEALEEVIDNVLPRNEGDKVLSYSAEDFTCRHTYLSAEALYVSCYAVWAVIEGGNSKKKLFGAAQEVDHNGIGLELMKLIEDEPTEDMGNIAEWTARLEESALQLITHTATDLETLTNLLPQLIALHKDLEDLAHWANRLYEVLQPNHYGRLPSMFSKFLSSMRRLFSQIASDQYKRMLEFDLNQITPLQHSLSKLSTDLFALKTYSDRQTMKHS